MPASTTTDQRPQSPQIGDGETVNARRARQGFRDRPILYVLLASLALVVLAFAVAYFTNNKDVNGSYERTQDRAAAQSFDTPEPAPKVVPSN